MIDPVGLQVGESHTSAAVQVRDVLKALGCSGHHGSVPQFRMRQRRRARLHTEDFLEGP